MGPTALGGKPPLDAVQKQKYRVRDKHKFQVAAQHPLHFSLGGWQAAQGPSDKVTPGWRGKPAVPDSPYLLETHRTKWPRDRMWNSLQSEHSAFTTCSLELGPPCTPTLLPPPFHPVPQTEESFVRMNLAVVISQDSLRTHTRVKATATPKDKPPNL